MRNHSIQDTTYTYCQICEQACGLKVTHADNRVIRIEPDKDNPHSWQDFCIKGARAARVLEHPQRIRLPMQRVNGRYVERSYDEALSDISARMNQIIHDHGADAIASYAGNPNGMDFGASAFLPLLMDAIGSHNRFWVSSVDQNALHYVAQAMYGHAFATLQLDLDRCSHIMLIGANPAVSGMCWIGHSANGWKRLLQRQAQGKTRIVIVDPVRTQSARKADIHIAARPEQDWALLLAMIKVIFDSGLQDQRDCDQALGIDALREAACAASLADLAARCGVTDEQIRELAISFAQSSGAAVIARTGPAMGRNGALTEWLSHALNLITGNTDRPGGRIYNPGLVDPMLAGDEIFRPGETPSRVRGLAPVAGYHALAELPDEINTPGPGQIRTLLMSGGNPVVSGPDGQALDGALAKLDLLVAIDLVQRESHRHAHWLIPAAHWLERGEFNPLLSGLSDAAYAQMGRAAVTMPEGMRHEWEFLRDLALAMDVPLMGSKLMNHVARASRTIADLTGNPYHGFGPQWMSRLLLYRSGRRKGPGSWKSLRDAEHGVHYGQLKAGALRSNLAAQNRQIHAAPAPLLNQLMQQLSAPDTQPAEYPLQLVSRRRLQTMNSWYAEITAADGQGCEVDMHPADAEALNIHDGDPVQVISASAELQATARISEHIRRGVVIMEQGWGSRVFNPADGTSSHIGVNRNLLVSNQDLDPLTSVPRLNGAPVRISPVQKKTL